MNVHAPGVYLGMPEDEYHADHSFSSSGVKNITVSPLDFWVKSWMNPDYVEKERPALQLGKAYHKLVLEGREAFNACYAVKPDKEDYPEALDGSVALKAYCAEHGLPKSGTIAELCERISDHNPDVELWPLIDASFKEECGHLEHLSKKDWADLKLVELVMRRSPSTANAFVNGVPEVSIFWVNNGTPMKARIDYVKPMALLDLKSFANQMDNEIVSAVATDVARRRYYIQPVVYTQGWNAMKALFKSKGDEIIQGDGDKDIIREALTNEDKTRFFFVFLQTGGVPNVVVREFSEWETFQRSGASQNAYWYRGEETYMRGLRLYRSFMSEFGTGQPWIADFGNKPFQDIDFPAWMLNAPLEIAS
ncbi:MAG: PD-(D/E)XK nuclease-like domain-containing protein [Alphaproteobacteria bacterium]|nr:PD-(D/E)XK nuclease-like domain-containing protein [Alphaproteobacteria bacterium]MBO6629043.1 PD-(D/E)XK nuclease-like domain-containing protein [Alphaproteobacteria bacterium]